MADPNQQAALVAALRKKAEELAAANPVLAEMRRIGKTLVDEVRRRANQKDQRTSIGAYLVGESVSLIEPIATKPEEATAELLSKLRDLAKQGEIKAAGVCDVIERKLPSGPVEKFVRVHLEHATGKAQISGMPIDESVLTRSVPGASGPSVAVFGGPTTPKIFAGNANAPVLKIAVYADGQLRVDGAPATMDSLRALLKRLAEQKGVVWYYREAGHSQAPPESTEVIKAVTDNRLPIRLSSRPDYSDSIGLDGKPITRLSKLQ